MRKNATGASVVRSFILFVMMAAARQATAQDARAYPMMATIDEYLMPDREAEIALARSAAPPSISNDATILVLGRNGYETAVEGKNGFVCLVDRGWTGPFDWPEFWNPRIRAAGCLNPQAARSILPIGRLRASMVMAGRSTTEILSALNAAYGNQALPNLESGAMAYMMSKSAYLTDQGEHTLPHLMFYTYVKNSEDWGANVEGSPVLASPFWFFSPKDDSQVKDLPSILVFLVGLNNWSDGTPVHHGPS